jgi:hypothetical protein
VGAASGDAEAVSGDGAALEEEWGEIKGEATGCQVPGWAGRSPFFVLDRWINGTDRLLWNDSMPPY